MFHKSGFIREQYKLGGRRQMVMSAFLLLLQVGQLGVKNLLRSLGFSITTITHFSLPRGGGEGGS